MIWIYFDQINSEKTKKDQNREMGQGDMIMTVSPLVIWFVKGMICLFVVGFIYRLWKYYITDKTFADSEILRISALQKHSPDFRLIRDKPEPKYVEFSL